MFLLPVVDKRRAKFELQPLAEFVKFWNIEYKKPG
jgi:hypothetical protein